MSIELTDSIMAYLKQRFDFGEESPPIPVPQLEVGSGVPLNDSDGVDLFLASLEGASGQITPTIRLEVDDQICVGRGNVGEGKWRGKRSEGGKGIAGGNETYENGR